MTRLSNLVNGNHNRCNTCKYFNMGTCTKLNRNVEIELRWDMKVDDCPKNKK